jgi:DNA-binding response OmpR family regulator
MATTDSTQSRAQKILVVEDDPHILLGLEERLRSEGFEVASHAWG